MKRYLTALILAATGLLTMNAQQTPLSENYFMDRYSLSPAYAGQVNPGMLVTGYRSDWSGISGGPKTLTITYNDLLPVMNGAGVGGKLVYDKAGIFGQLYLMGSYSYRVEAAAGHFIMFGLSAGLYHNSINLTDYYNDPGYNIDPALVQADVKSKLKFMSDISVAYNWQNLDAGFLFSNISFGDASYREVALKYNPLSNFRFHASYHYNINEDWAVTPLIILRGGKYIKSQFEMAAQVMWIKKVWGTIVFRDPGIFGFGLGGKILSGISLGYNFNMATNVALNAFNSHEFALGINIGELLGK
ncbi:MAG: PorP/SprF family type IX secretion system membrane protein [Bacteroidales bacterium]|nr:PorP/SprF family type IX secretion system membrane protein [Bacteroidales bacterium]